MGVKLGMNLAGATECDMVYRGYDVVETVGNESGRAGNFGCLLRALSYYTILFVEYFFLSFLV